MKTKYLILALALILITAGAALSADNVADVGQVVVVAGDNSAFVEQLGDLNVAKVGQLSASGNNADVRQHGNLNQLVGVNPATGLRDSSLPAAQVGLTNDLTVRQFGNGNEAGLSQVALLGENKAGIFQINGDNNALTAAQGTLDGNNTLGVVQSGNSHTATLSQGTLAGNNVAGIAQFNGDNNTLDASQITGAGNNILGSVQVGNSNDLKAIQATVEGNNTLLNAQVGNLNSADVAQGTPLGDNTAGIGQIGNGNTLLAGQAVLSEGNNKLAIKQDGNGNQAILGQLTATGGNQAGTLVNPLIQEGNNNIMGVVQIAAEGNTLKATQTGDNNTLGAVQLAPGGTNILDAKQLSSGNSASVYMSTPSGNNSATIIQN